MIETFYKLSSRRIGQRGDDPSAGAKLKAGPGVECQAPGSLLKDKANAKMSRL